MQIVKQKKLIDENNRKRNELSINVEIVTSIFFLLNIIDELLCIPFKNCSEIIRI